jgi:hypothetical protein
MALFDSDLLFFTEPVEYLERIEDAEYSFNTFNSDVAEAYTVEKEAVEERFGHELASRVNTGLGLVHARSIRREWIEQYLELPGILDGHFWRIEQTLIALCSSRHGVELLPDEYSVSLAPGQRTGCFRHYVGAIRHLMYGEGIRRLATEGFWDRAMSPS